MFIITLMHFFYKFFQHTGILFTLILGGISLKPSLSVRKFISRDHATLQKLSKLSRENLRNVNIIARTVYGEARNQTQKGRQAVVHVILNRASQSRTHIPKVVYKRKQFSCWNQRDPNRKRLEIVNISNPVFKNILDTCVETMQGTQDVTQGADHYHVTRISPRWKKQRHLKPTIKIGDHIFYKKC